MNTFTGSSDQTESLEDLLNISALDETEQAAMAHEVGSLVIESALVRFMISLEDSQRIALEHYLETNPDPETLLNHILEHHPDFSELLKEEAAAFKEEATNILGK